MTWKYIHLVLNPFPIVLSIAGTVVGLAGWIAGRPAWERWGVTALLLAAVAAPFTYYSGIAAGDVVAQRTFVKPGLIQTHRTWATWTLIAIVADGVFAAFSAFQPEDGRLRRFVILVGVACAVLAGITGFMGGRIAHGPEERRSGPAAGTDSMRAPTATTDEGRDEAGVVTGAEAAVAPRIAAAPRRPA